MLVVAVPGLEVEGEGELHTQAGSNVTLGCLVTNTLERPGYSFWSVLPRNFPPNFNSKISNYNYDKNV